MPPALSEPALSDPDLRVMIQRLARRLRAERAEADLTDGQLSVLFVLAKEGPLGLGELSARDRVTPPSMNRTVNALVEAGFVTRAPSEHDGRKVVIDLSPSGRSIVAETRRRRDEWFSLRLARLTPRQRAVLNEAGPILRELSDS